MRAVHESYQYELDSRRDRMDARAFAPPKRANKRFGGALRPRRRVKPGHDTVPVALACRWRLHVCGGASSYFPALFGSATIMSSSMRAPGEDSWLMHTVVDAGSQSPK